MRPSCAYRLHELAGLLLLCCTLTAPLAASDQDPSCFGSPTDAVTVAVGDGYYVALQVDGRLWCSLGAAATPSGTGYRAIAAGQSDAWALTAEGVAVSWNIRSDRARLIRQADGPFVSLTYRRGQAFGIAADGSVRMITGTLAPPVDLGPIRQIEVTDGDISAAMALTADGHVRTWSGASDFLTPPGDLSDVAQIALGTRHALARRNDGTVVAWGDDAYGQATVPSDLPPVRRIMAGADWSAAILQDGRMIVWGGAWYGPYQSPAGLTDAVEGAGNGLWMVIRRNDGTAFLVAGSPHQLPYGVSAWANEGEDAAIVVVSRRTESAPLSIPLHHTEPFQGITLDNLATMPAGGRYATVRIQTQRSASGHDRWAQIIADPQPMDPYSGDWSRGARLMVAGLAPDVSMNLSPVGTVHLGAWNNRAYVAADAAGRCWPLGMLTDGDIRRMPPAGERVLATASNTDLSESLALCADGRVIASWRGWVAVSGVGTVRSLVPGSATLVVRSDDTLFDIRTRAVLASDVASAQNALLLHRDGSVAEIYAGGLATPADLGPCVAVCSGSGFAAAARIDGSVRVWQQSYINPGLVPPPGLTDVVQLACGIGHILALRRDGTVVAWGSGMGPETDVPPGLSDVIAVAATGSASAALRSDGIVVTWPDEWYVVPPHVPEGGAFVAVLRTSETVPVDTDVALRVTGDASLAVASPARIPAGQALVTVPVSAPVDVDDQTDLATLLAAEGDRYEVIQRVGWISVIVDDASPVLKVSWSPTQVAEAAVLGSLVACRLADGRISAWGMDYPSPELTRAILADPGLHGLALSNDLLLGLDAAGSVHALPLRIGYTDTQCIPPAGLPPITQLAAGARFVAAVQADGRVRVWGDWAYGQPPADLVDVRRAVVSEAAIIAIRNDGSATGWGATWSPILPIPAVLPPIADIACSGDHAVALLEDGTVRAWGDDRYGQLLVPAGLDHVVSIACYGSATWAVRSDGTVVAWGMGVDGKPAAPPAWLPPLTRVLGGTGICGVTAAGTVVSWDSAEAFQGARYCREGDSMAFQAMLSGPVALRTEVQPDLSSAPAGAMSIVHPAVIEAGTAFASGLAIANQDQQDSQDATVSASIAAIPGLSVAYGTNWPVRFRDLLVFDDEPAISLAVSPTELQAAAVLPSYSMIGLRHDGRVVAWGQSSLVPLCRNRPGVRAFAVGGEHVLFLGLDGSVTAVGTNTYGQCAVPNGLGPVRAIAAGYRFSMALREDGTIACWGAGADFQPMHLPAGLDQVVALAVGGGAAAVKADGSLAIWDTVYPVPILRGPVRSLYADSRNWIATLQDGTVQAWGELTGNGLSPPDGLTDVRATYVGLGIGTAFHSDGTCTFWGPRAHLVAQAETGPLLSVSSDSSSTIGLRQDGTISYVWGESGQRYAEGFDGDSIAVRLARPVAATADLTIGIDWSGVAESSDMSGPAGITITAGSLSGWATYRIGPDDNGTTDTYGVQMRRGDGYGPDYWAQFPTSLRMWDDGIGTPMITVAPDRSDVAEGSDMRLWVTASAAYDHDTFWNIQVQGDAESGDYQLPAMPILLPAGQLRASCLLDTVIDADIDDETLQLSVPDGHGYQISTRVLTIADRGDGAGPLLAARFGHSATLLPSGLVLVAGGTADYGITLYASELFDPQNGRWRATTSALLAPRTGHSATLLPSGKVLVVGGRWYSEAMASCELFDPGLGTWAAVSNLLTARAGHTASLLPSGDVLVAGGSAGGIDVTTCETYDPRADRWSVTTGPLATPRSFAAATLLPSGQVLVTGGRHGTDLASCEIYNPAAGTWSATGPLSAPRSEHAATLLQSGLVLVSGGSNPCELFDPGSGSWRLTGTMAGARKLASSTLLPTGKVLMAGGYSPATGMFLGSTEVFDPTTEAWTPGPDLGSVRQGHTATLLPSGDVVIAGGQRTWGFAQSSCEIYRSGTGSWTAAGGDLLQARSAHTLTLLASGEVLAAGGIGPGALATSETRNPLSGTWSATAAPMSVARYDHAAAMLRSGTVLAAGGRDGTSRLATSELYDPAVRIWTPTAGGLSMARSGHAMTTLADGRVLAVGGSDAGGSLRSAEIFDPEAASWSLTAMTPLIARDHATATLLPSGRVLVVGGSDGGRLDSCELYDPVSSTWLATGSLTTPRSAHKAILLQDGRVLAIGGSVAPSSEIYDPATGVWTASSHPMLTVRERAAATLLPDGHVLVCGGGFDVVDSLSSCEMYRPAEDDWVAMPDLLSGPHADAQAVLLPQGQVLVAGGSDAGNPVQTCDRMALPGHGLPLAPAIAGIAASAEIGAHLTLTGSAFKGVSESSSGASGNSPTDHPLVQVSSVINGATAWLGYDPASAATANTVTLLPAMGLPPGVVWVRVYANGLASPARSMLLVPNAQQIHGFDSASLGAHVYGDAPFGITGVSGGDSGCALRYSSDSPGVATVTGSTVTIHGAGSAWITAEQDGQAYFAPAQPVRVQLMVGKAALRVRALDRSVQEGQSLPALGYTIEGFAYSDDASVIGGSPGLSTTATSASPPGTYPIAVDVASMTSANYVCTGVSGTLTILTAPATESAPQGSGGGGGCGAGAVVAALLLALGLTGLGRARRD